MHEESQRRFHFQPNTQEDKTCILNKSSQDPCSCSACHPLRISSVVTGQTFGAEHTILKQVSNVRLSGKVEMTRDLQECDIIIIFCPIISRVGSDVDAAMGNMAGHKPAILVLMHHTRDVDYSTSGRKWSEKYPNVKLELHVLYHETQPGLLDCQQNTEAISEIQKELYENSRWRWA
ncbi:hypothetical protein Q5P01_000030 [Channa striata]|uniref:Uncharacterized protein n=1 Tax=Channa striata TaxID=64152 RepID=A0AA88IK64_CHASR|nr:hypothetical protein Q5P01_000030 [Channa striata]